LICPDLDLDLDFDSYFLVEEGENFDAFPS
jgi:hypothetical protein